MNIKSFVEVNFLFILINLAVVIAIAIHSIIWAIGSAVVLLIVYSLFLYQDRSKNAENVDTDTVRTFSIDNVAQFLKSKDFFEIVANQLNQLAEQSIVMISLARESRQQRNITRDAEATKIRVEKRAELTTKSSTIAPAIEDSPFKLRKKGMILNIFLFAIGVVPLFIIINILSEVLHIDITNSDLGALLIVIILAINFIYYIPTFICYSPSKLLIFILNALVSWTLIGWVILLMYAFSSNRAYRYREEMLHFQRKM